MKKEVGKGKSKPNAAEHKKTNWGSHERTHQTLKTNVCTGKANTKRSPSRFGSSRKQKGNEKEQHTEKQWGDLAGCDQGGKKNFTERTLCATRWMSEKRNCGKKQLGTADASARRGKKKKGGGWRRKTAEAKKAKGGAMRGRYVNL